MKRITKGIAFLLCISMLFGLCPSSAYATGSDTVSEPVEEQVLDQIQEAAEEQVLNQVQEQPEETIVELGWTTCQDADLKENNTFVKASGKGITGISAIWDNECEEFLSNQYGGEFDVYRVQVEGYKEGDVLTLAFDIETLFYDYGTDNLKLYRIDTVEGVKSIEELTIQKKEFHTEAGGVEFVTVTFETTKTGVFAIGNVQEVPEEPQTGELIIKELPSKLVYQLGEAFEASGLEVVCVENGVETPLSEEEYTVTADLSKNGPQTVTVTYGTLSASFDIWVRDPNNRTKVGIYVKELPTKTEYVVGETFDRTGLVVVAYLDDNTEYEIATYDWTTPDMTTPGIKEVTVTEKNDTAVFYITVKEPQPEPVEEEMTVTLEDDSKLTVKIETSALEKVTYKITDVHNYIWVNTLLSKVYDGDFIALNIQPDENFIPGQKTTVTLPRPAHITSPAVYCLTEEEGIVERIMDVTVEDDMVSFVTDHFSVYAIGEGDEGKRFPVVVEEEAWVETTELKNDKPILILNTNNGTVEGTTAQALSIQTDNNNVKSEQVTIYYDGTKSYVLTGDVKNNSQWYPINKGNEWQFQSVSKNTRYIGVGGYTGNRNLNTSSSGAEFTYRSKQLIYDGSWGFDCFIGYAGTQWAIGTTSRNVYIFTNGSYKRTYQLELALESADNIRPAGGKYVYTVDGENLKAQVIPSGVPVEKNGTYEYVSLAEDIATVEPNGEIEFTGEVGSTIIQATYWWEENGERKETKSFIEIETAKPVYAIDILDENNQSITNTVAVKNVSTDSENPTIRQLNGKLTKDGVNQQIEPDKVTWISSDETIATVDEKTGQVTFTGKEGNVRVNVVYTYADGSSVTDAVIFSVKRDNVIIPSDGTNDFPEYPNEGSIRFDKHATAVGNFSDTGVVQVELSMTGIPYTKGSEIDVVMMLDTSTSIDDVDGREEAAAKAAQAALEILVKNEDGTFNGNRVAVYGFNGWTDNNYDNHIEAVSEYYPGYPGKGTGIDANSGDNNVNISKITGMQTYDSDSFQSAYNAISTQYQPDNLGAGTNYAAALRQCYLTLEKTRQSNRKQYVIFMTDGFASTGFAYQTNDGHAVYDTSDSELSFNGLNGVVDPDIDLANKTEYYSAKMKAAGVEIYSVGLQVGGGVENVTDAAIEAGQTVLKNIASEDHAMFIGVNNSVQDLVEAFRAIAQSIKQAATNVVVTDKIADEYTMIFEPPANYTTEVEFPGNQELYIEVLEYQLEAQKAADGTITDYLRGNSKSLAKIYLGKNGNNYFAASDAKGTPFAAPAMKAVTDGKTKAYWNLLESANGYDIIDEDGNYYKFAPKGDGTHNMESGAFASGTENDKLKIASPYFFYDAESRILVWTSEKLSSSELALSYFLYLDRSAGWEGHDNQQLPGTYETNDYAFLNYTNHLGNDCEQEFPVPQMTWNGAQVSYVFYLVNESGQPVNRAGRVVPFSEAVYITDVFTESIVWNDLEEIDRLSASMLAQELVPDIYTLYDEQAEYTIHVFKDETGADLNNHFRIDGSADETVNTTYVFNTKSDAEKYNRLGVYSGKTEILCKDYNVKILENGKYDYDGDATQYIDPDIEDFVYDTETIDGVEVPYTIVYQNVAKENIVNTGFDFSNTTVAFAVKWRPKLKPDTIVLDYGLDVVIDVAQNDGISGDVIGVRKDSDLNAPLNEDNEFSNMCTARKATTTDVYLNNNNGDNFKIGTATLLDNTSVRFSLDKDNGMQMKDWAKFYYESSISYYQGTDLRQQDMYTSVTVIPATTIYYEDEYVTLATLTKKGTEITTEPGGWDIDSEAVATSQQVDRPGTNKLGELYDADNLYGSDAAYLQCSQASMGSGAKIRVGNGKSGTAKFEFYGTGFDVISMTSNTTGTIIVEVTGEDNFKKRYVVDTYYGYKYVDKPEAEDPKNDFNNNGDLSDDHWVIDPNADNSLWQVPVIKVEGLSYGKYEVTITASYSAFFDHDQYDNSTYDFYLDAIRIYDPAGRDDDDGIDELIKNAYISDREYLPEYYELRNLVIEAKTFGTLKEADAVPGIVFIDGKNEVTTADISDYISYGPNNELYLEPGQIVVFNLNAQREDNYAVDMVQLAWKSVGGTAKAKIWNPKKMNASSVEVVSVETATDMYFDITDLTDLENKTVVIQNVGEEGDSILSITNIKLTAKEKTTVEEPPAAQEMAMFSVSRAAVEQALLSLNNEIPEPEPPKVEPEKPAPEEEKPAPDKPEQDKPAPEAPKVEVNKPAPEAPKVEVNKPAPEVPKAETETPAPEVPKTETEEPVESVPEKSESEDDSQTKDDFENQNSETEEMTKKGIIAKLIEFIRLIVRSIINWFSRWF